MSTWFFMAKIGHAIIFLPGGFYLSDYFFFPRLISAVAYWMSAILPHIGHILVVFSSFVIFDVFSCIN